MKKILIGVILFLSLSISLFADISTRGNEYQAWFNSFLQRFTECSNQLSPQDKTDLQDLLNIKPKFDTGRFYNLWLGKAFCMYVDETAPILDSSEIEKFAFIMAAMPDLQGSNSFYHFYLDYVIKEIDDFMPVLDANEKKYFDYFRKAKPMSLEADFESWLSKYNQYKSDFGPVYDANENEALRLLMDIKPAGDSQENINYQVKRETLLRIRNLIQNQQPNSAMAEIDKILNGQGN
ncbi:MAG: hypothetical protein WA705_07345 [Candidatus Ozemobacteraceae bacterium]